MKKKTGRLLLALALAFAVKAWLDRQGQDLVTTREPAAPTKYTSPVPDHARCATGEEDLYFYDTNHQFYLCSSDASGDS